MFAPVFICFFIACLNICQHMISLSSLPAKILLLCGTIPMTIVALCLSLECITPAFFPKIRDALFSKCLLLLFASLFYLPIMGLCLTAGGFLD